MKFASYELVPSDVQDKLIKEFEAKQAEEWFSGVGSLAVVTTGC